MQKLSVDINTLMQSTSPRVQQEPKPIIFAGMAKENKPQIMMAKSGINSRRDRTSQRSNIKNEKLYDEIVKQFDIYEFLDVKGSEVKSPQTGMNKIVKSGISNGEYPFSEQLEFDLDEQDIEQFKLKDDSSLDDNWEPTSIDPQTKQEKRKLDAKFQVSTTELPKASDELP